MKKAVRIALSLLILAAVGIAALAIHRKQSTGPPIGTLLDYAPLLKRPEVVRQRLAAEKDLPTDTWTTSGPRINGSRNDRAKSIASPLFREIESIIRRMTTEALWDSIVTWKSMRHLEMGDVPDELYAGGNALIIEALKGKPRHELEALLVPERDSDGVYDGPNGLSPTRGYLLNSLLDKTMKQP